MQTAKCLIGFGSNKMLGGMNSASIVDSAFASLGRLWGAGRCSRLYQSEAWPDPSDPPYINAVAVFKVTATPESVLAVLQTVEAAFSRHRSEAPEQRYAPRTLDLDLLDYEGAARTSAELTLPHPAILDRVFVMLPLRDVCPDWVHPVTGQSLDKALSGIDRSGVQEFRGDDF